MSQKEIEQLSAGMIQALVTRVATQARGNWLNGNDNRQIQLEAKLPDSLNPTLTNFHYKLLNMLGSALVSGNYTDIVRLVEDEGRALANRHIPFESVVQNISACMSRWVTMILDEAEQETGLQLNHRAFQSLVRRLNQLQSRLMIASVSGYNDQVESGEIWLHQSRNNGASHLVNSKQDLADYFFEQLTSITGEYSISRYRAGVPIFNDSHDFQRSRFYFIRSGTVQIQEYLSDGRALTLTILGRGDVFARFTTNVGNNSRYFRDFQVETMRECEVVWVEETALQRAMERSPAVATSIIKSFSTQLANVQQLIQGLLGRDVSARLAHLLLKLADEFGTNQGNNTILIDYPLSHQRLADMMGSNRVTVTRQLSELQKQGILEIQRRSITIYNRRLLENFGAS